MMVCTIELGKSWIILIIKYIEEGVEPGDSKEATLTRRWASSYSIIEEKLFRRGFSRPLLKCLEGEEAEYVLSDIHEGICRQYLGSRSLVQKPLGASYYWPTMIEDAKKLVKKVTNAS